MLGQLFGQMWDKALDKILDGAFNNFLNKSTKKILLTGSSLEVQNFNSGIEELKRDCEHLGFEVRICPVFNLTPVSGPLSASSPLRLTGEEDLIFITKQAVNVFKNFCQTAGIKLPRESRCFAIGDGTATYFKSLFSNHPIYFPEAPGAENSEGLVALPEFDFMTGRRVFIFRGDSGREFLADELRARGALVEYVTCYTREVNPEFHRFWAREDAGLFCDVVVLTSTESLRIFLETPRVLNPQKAQKSDDPWITVLPGRMLELAREHGYPNILLLDNASNAAVLEALKKNFDV
jgi:uroporphyrinogen-III synthase